MKLSQIARTLPVIALMFVPGLSQANDKAELAVGQKLYDSACVACHGTGAAGAPELGNKAAWAPYIAGGRAQMMQVALQGKGAMPARGGTDASDAEMKAAVEYIIHMSQ